MIDWTSSMTRTFEYYTVDPNTWKDKTRLTNVKTSSINRDEGVETLGSATIDATESLGECYVRIYQIIIQNGIEYKIPMGTFLVQTPSTSFDGKIREVSMDAYTPLIELKENQPPIGYSLLEDDNIMDIAYRLTREHARAPVVYTANTETLYSDFVSDTDDTWLKFLSDLVANAKYKYGLDELGRILFLPKQDTASLQPVWTYTDDNSSILQPPISMDHDLYGIPNAVEVTYSKGGKCCHTKVVNDDPNSPTSTVNRGREILYRAINPESLGDLSSKITANNQSRLDNFAKQLLRDLSSVEYTISYTHGYCPVGLGDCIRLNYKKAGLTDIKAKVISQSIKCNTECQVTEKAVFTTKLWDYNKG